MKYDPKGPPNLHSYPLSPDEIRRIKVALIHADYCPRKATEIVGRNAVWRGLDRTTIILTTEDVYTLLAVLKHYRSCTWGERHPTADPKLTQTLIDRLASTRGIAATPREVRP